MTATPINETDKIGCPIMDITMRGKTEDEYALYSDTIRDYTDGYNLEMKLTFGEFSVADAAGNAGVCIGTMLSGNNNSAPNGAYCYEWATLDQSTTTGLFYRGAADPTVFFVDGTEDVWAGSASADWAGVVDMADTVEKYNSEFFPDLGTTASDTAFAPDSEIMWTFFMPKDDPDVTEGPTSSAGDRINKKDKVYMLGAPVSSGNMGAADYTEVCGNGEIVLGAVSKLVSSFALLSACILAL